MTPEGSKPRQRPLKACVVVVALVGSGFIVTVLTLVGCNFTNVPSRPQPSPQQARSTEYWDRILDSADAAAAQATEYPETAADTLTELVKSAMQEQQADASGLTGEAKIVADAGIEVRRQLMQSALDENALLTRFAEAGGIDPSTLTTNRSFRYRRALLQDVMDQMHIRDAIIDELPDRYRALLAANGMQPQDIDTYTDLYVRGAQLELLRQMREIKWQAINDIARVLDLLERNHTRWSVDAEGAVEFGSRDDELADEYAGLLARIQGSDQRIAKLYEQMSKNARRMLNDFNSYP